MMLKSNFGLPFRSQMQPYLIHSLNYFLALTNPILNVRQNIKIPPQKMTHQHNKGKENKQSWFIAQNSELSTPPQPGDN
jgi:hypothetical protein